MGWCNAAHMPLSYASTIAATRYALLFQLERLDAPLPSAIIIFTIGPVHCRPAGDSERRGIRTICATQKRCQYTKMMIVHTQPAWSRETMPAPLLNGQSAGSALVSLLSLCSLAMRSIHASFLFLCQRAVLHWRRGAERGRPAIDPQ